MAAGPGWPGSRALCQRPFPAPQQSGPCGPWGPSGPVAAQVRLGSVFKAPGVLPSPERSCTFFP